MYVFIVFTSYIDVFWRLLQVLQQGISHPYSNIPAFALTKVKLTWDNVLLMYFAQHPLKDQEMIHPCC